MKRKSFIKCCLWPRRFLSAFLMVMVIVITALPQPVMANPMAPVDSCIRIDHPPFIENYGGDGYSYLKLGLTLLLETYDPGSEFKGELSGVGKAVASSDSLNERGQVFFTFPLYGYGAYEVMVYDANGVVIYQDAVTVSDKEVACDFGSLAVSPAKAVTTVSTAATSPETTAATTAETTAETRVETEAITETVGTVTQEATEVTSLTDSEGPDGPSWWPLVLIAGGVFSVLAGFWLLSKRSCDKEHQGWLSASEKARAASEKAREAQAAAETLSDAKEQLEEELADIQRVYPSAGREGGDEAWVEMDGRRITSRDVAMGREAERAAWDDYRSNPSPESASQLEADWKNSATPASVEERRELDKEAKALNEAIKAAKKAADEALEEAKNAKAAEVRAGAEADAARRAYEACMHKASAPPAPTPEPQPGTSGGASGGSSGGGPKVSTGPGANEGSGCRENEPPQERNRTSLGSVSLPVKLEVILEGGGAHEAALAANDISGQLAHASEKLGWISKLMDIKGIGGALVRDGVGWSLLGAAAPPAAGMALDVPVPTSPGQLAVDTLSLLGKISSVIIGKVPELQERRLPDCDVQGTFVNNVYSAECVEIWVCRNGQWVKDRSRFTLTLISQSRGRMTKRTALTWAQAQQEIGRYEQQYRSRLASALDRVAQLEARCR